MVKKDLIILVADKNICFTVKGLLKRHKSIGMSSLDESNYDIRIFTPEHDPGCYQKSHLFLRPFINKYIYALVIFDLEFDKKKDLTKDDLEMEVLSSLETNGWRDRSAVIVIDPELEIWVWSQSPHVEKILGWDAESKDLKQWLIDSDFQENDEKKPKRPKEALESVLRKSGKPRSSSLYYNLASKVSLKRCEDRSFIELKAILQKWFPSKGALKNRFT